MADINVIAREFISTGILGFDDVLGGAGEQRGRLRGERLLLTGPPGSGKTLVAMSLLYKALLSDGDQESIGLYITTDEQKEYIVEALQGVLLSDAAEALADTRLKIVDFPPYKALGHETFDPTTIVERILTVIREEIETHAPRHIVIDGLTSLQSVTPSLMDARRLSHSIKAYLSNPRTLGFTEFDLIVMTAESAYSQGNETSFDAYLVDTVVFLDSVHTPADRRLRTIEVTKSRGRHSRSGRHTFSIVSASGATSLMSGAVARERIQTNGVPVVVFPREPRSERSDTASITRESTYVSTGIQGLNTMVDEEQQRGLRSHSTTLLIGGPGTGTSIVALRFIMEGILNSDTERTLFVSFGRNRADFGQLKFEWLQDTDRGVSSDRMSFLHYRPINLDQNRLFYEIRAEVEKHKINRVVIDSVSSLPMLHADDDISNDFLVTLINLLRELGTTSLLTFVLNRTPENMEAPGSLIPSLTDYIIVLANRVESDGSLRRTIRMLKGRGTTAIYDEASIHFDDRDLRIDV